MQSYYVVKENFGSLRNFGYSFVTVGGNKWFIILD